MKKKNPSIFGLLSMILVAFIVFTTFLVLVCIPELYRFLSMDPSADGFKDDHDSADDTDGGKIDHEEVRKLKEIYTHAFSRKKLKKQSQFFNRVARWTMP